MIAHLEIGALYDLFPFLADFQCFLAFFADACKTVGTQWKSLRGFLAFGHPFHTDNIGNALCCLLRVPRLGVMYLTCKSLHSFYDLCICVQRFDIDPHVIWMEDIGAEVTWLKDDGFDSKHRGLLLEAFEDPC